MWFFSRLVHILYLKLPLSKEKSVYFIILVPKIRWKYIKMTFLCTIFLDFFKLTYFIYIVTAVQYKNFQWHGPLIRRYITRLTTAEWNEGLDFPSSGVDILETLQGQQVVDTCSIHFTCQHIARYWHLALQLWHK